ncbi:MAG: BMP family ABC transporter substrate-binding protein, partial [Treponema sp.]|nr:BMP family ABC transporter substrate-binding protein [Treponema sp.]
MKRYFLTLAFITTFALTALVFVGCAKKQSNAVDAERPTVRLVTDATGVDDKSFNAAAWRGILEFYNDTWENQSLRGKLYDVV